MSYERENRQAMISYFEQGSKGSALRPLLGVEVEHFVVYKDTLRAVPYDAGSAGGGVRDVLTYLSQFYPQKMYGIEGDLIGLSSSRASLTLEPAAQLEISIAPFSSIETIVSVYCEFRAQVDPFLDEHGCMLVTQGYHPFERALDLPLIPKQRYRFMDAYFRDKGTHGERMMRASASTQVSVDYADEADAVRKMRIAQALTPLFAYMTDNVTRFEGEVPKQPLSRLAMWRDVDNDRCGSVPGIFDEGFGFGAYADWLLRTCPIFVTRASADDPEGAALREVAGRTAASVYADAPMSQDDIEHLLSMFWPDVRLKRFVEIRPADALPVRAMAGYAALIKGIFYSPKALDRIEDALGVVGDKWPLDDGSTDRAAQAIREQGLQANVYGSSLQEWKALVFDLARETLTAQESSHLDEFEQWMSER